MRRDKLGSLALSFAIFLVSLPLAAEQNPAIFPTGLAYGYMPVGATATQTVSVYNISGSANVTVNSITPSIKELKVVSGTLPITIGPGKRADYGIQFNADAAQAFTGHLTFAIANQPSQAVNITANGTNSAAVPVLNVSSMTFPSTSLGTASPAQTLTITNNGTATFSVTGVVVTYPFSQVGWNGTTTAIAPGSSLKMSVAYFPTIIGNQTGMISITYDTAAPQGLSLWGTGGNPTKMAITNFRTLPSATQGYMYQATLGAVGGVAPYTWKLATGSTLPTGLSLSSTGMITGTLASSVAVGNYTFSVTATGANTRAVTSVLTLPVGSYSGPKNCNTISVNAGDGSGPIIPINDLGTGSYLGAEEGGLYANGSNADDPSHDAYGQSAAAAIVPLDANGNYDPNGKYVFISVGLSVAQQPFSEFVSLVNTDPSKNGSLVIVDAATGGATAALLASSTNNFWNPMIYDYLPNAGVTANQVVGAWILDVDGGPGGVFPADMVSLQSQLESIAQNLLIKFPNIKLAYYSSINYTGYSNGTTNLNPEPYAYENGMAVKNAIEDQIGGDPALNFNPANGTVKAPWMAWGPYYWANGMIPRSDGLVWTCQDLDTDGTHPSNPGGRIKVSAQLLNFLKTDDTASKWFLAPGARQK